MVVNPEISPLERQIIRQVEYYFGDFNLPKDKFLQETMKEDDGWIKLETLLKFHRLANISKEQEAIMAALKKSDSGLLELNSEADSKVRRSPAQPLPENNEETKKALEAKTAYAKGFDKENTTMDELLEYYAEHEPTVVNIQMRNYFDKKDKKRHFKGSVFLTFRTVEACNEYVAAESKKYKDTELESRKLQKVYHEEKAKEWEEKKKKKGDRKGKKEGEGEDGDKATETKEEEKLPKGTVVKFTGLGSDAKREDIKEMLEKEFEVNIDKDSGDIAFVTYQMGEAEAKIRFKTENYGVELMKKLEKAEKIVVKEKELTASILEGEEEETFLAESLKDLKNHRNKQKNHKRKHGGGNHHSKRQRKN